MAQINIQSRGQGKEVVKKFKKKCKDNLKFLNNFKNIKIRSTEHLLLQK